MTALAHETLEAAMPTVTTPPSDLDDVLWQAWKAMELPEGYRAEIVEGFIEVSPTGRYSHARTANRLRRALDTALGGGEFTAYQDMNVIHGRKVWIPDVFVALEDADEHVTEDGLGIDAAAVHLVAEVVSPDADSRDRDRDRKRRAYARAGIPVYVIIDDYRARGSVTVLSDPVPDEARYASETTVAYGTAVAVPEGPAKGVVIDASITGVLKDTR
ncbi:Uma2 family endonuclease [Streptomyces sp. MMS21 TC-5]|uniref:Uma2 family endonuclease n=1 Tax=unclassified Streptomyces TaxID=2593676 RepID=UPI000B09F78C|nr:Uma2 family endonuclease [Streptomyces sp. MMS21 TC-5]MCI4082014.1 Uma2 family endonuclease [Streptomyces sp. MMS21 TC-5]